MRRKGGTHCSDFHFGCSAVPFPAPNRLFPPPNQAASAARRIFIFSIRTSGVRGPDTLWRVPWNRLLDAFSLLSYGAEVLQVWLIDKRRFIAILGIIDDPGIHVSRYKHMADVLDFVGRYVSDNLKVKFI